MRDYTALARAVRRADECYGIVTRNGEQEPCGKPAVAIVQDEGYWPACAWHVNRYGPGVPLSDIVAALRQSNAERLFWTCSRCGRRAPAHTPGGRSQDCLYQPILTMLEVES